ncbi:MAG TPA: hypothetical protein VF039_02700 [Longimicrobiales bacterium]
MTDAAAAYRERLARHAAEQQSAAARSRAIGTARVAVFAAFVAAGLWAEAAPSVLSIGVVAASIVAFVVLVGAHERARERERRAADLAAVQQAGLARVARAWSELPPRRAPAGITDPRVDDLDLFGRPALAQLLGPTVTDAGDRLLARWLLACATPAELAARQAAVRELSADVDFRDEVAVRARRALPMRPGELDSFLSWAEDEPWLTRRQALTWSARLLPLATILFASLQLTGALDVSLWLIPLGVTGWLALGPTGRKVHATFDRAFSREGIFEEFPALFSAAASLEPTTPRLHDLRDRIRSGGGAAPALQRLKQLMHSSDARHAAGLLYLPLLLLTLWPYHVLQRMERWQAASGRHARDWLDALAEIEALAALAAVAHDNPDWAFPALAEHADRIEANALGHPMLPPATRVDNDVTVGPPGTFLLVTGSNMSGKSTLLRALGTNLVLAGAGAPVCAAAMRMPRVALHTSVRVEDSLAQGVSYFMAQLQRVRDIVTAADARAADAHAGDAQGAPRVVYLLDEILAGTNSAERRVAATRVISHLVRSGAIGAVTTHDLELAGEPALASAARPVHFSETVHVEGEGAPMTFDYRLREGVATSTNALRLMALLGLTE